MKELTAEQIEELYEYAWVYSIYSYDLQSEVVDHLASAIEDIWEKEPDLPFDVATQRVIVLFGGEEGFRNLRMEKEKALKKKYWKSLFNYTIEFYKLPKIILTIFLSVLFYLSFKIAGNDQIVFIVMGTLFWLFFFFYFGYYHPKYLSLKVKEGHTFLMQKFSKGNLISKTVIIGNGLFFGLISHPMQLSTINSIIVSVLISFYFVLQWCDCIYIPRQFNKDIRTEFPNLLFA